MRSRRTVPAVLVVAVGAAIVAVLAGCGSSGSPGAGPRPSPSKPDVKGTITVSAAASLTEAFSQLGEQFHGAYPDARVTFNFGSSAALATQIQQGAPADVFASADQTSMQSLVTRNLISGAPTTFADNQLVIVTKPGNPEHVTGLPSLAKVPVVSLCGETVPCGMYAAEVLQKAGVTIPVSRITRGQDVKATLGAVTQGDATAAIVYVTDARSAGGAVAEVDIPAAQNTVASYPIAMVKASTHGGVARTFVDFVLSVTGQRTLARFGFLPPS